MSATDEHLNSRRVLLVAPTRRDGEVTCVVLRKADVHCVACADMRTLTAHLAEGAGAVMLTDHALVDPEMNAFLAALGRQPPWSDVPVLLLARNREPVTNLLPTLGALHNVTVLDRPVSTRSMVSAVLTALRARQRQYQIRDQISAQRKAEEALRDADRRKDEFLATLAHELRNPLAPIRTGLQVLARVPGDSPDASRMRQIMDRQMGQLVKLIDELLDVSRIATGKVKLRRELVDMRVVARTALETSQPLIDAAGHEIRIAIPSKPVWVVGDPSRLTQVISNLVNNAVKYTAQSGVITLHLEEIAGQAVVRVTDNGIGIPAELLEEVFDMFTQVDRTLDRSQGGLGIGLSLVRRLMELHGGTARAASAGLDRGSTFTIELPAVSSTTQPLPRCSEPITVPAARRGLRVLVVDDNVDAADSLSTQLSTNGHQTRTVYRGSDAMPVAAEFAPEIIFCDIGMPGMDGFEVASQLRADHRHAGTVLVALTGWGTEEDKKRTRNAGFDFHVVKPVSEETVEAILSRLHAAQ
jgi:signal transduction histidine kinase/CheY-like chemotaxis protein